VTGDAEQISLCLQAEILREHFVNRPGNRRLIQNERSNHGYKGDQK